MFFKTETEYFAAGAHSWDEVTVLDKIDTLVLHGGAFHTDDVLTAVMMRKLEPSIRILRETDNEKIGEYLCKPSVMVADVGRGDFDHHQTDVPLNDFGMRHAACGRVYEAIRDSLPLSPVQRENLEFVIPHIEHTDNDGSRQLGKIYNDLAAAVNSMRPTFLEVEESGMTEQECMNVAFGKAMQLINNTLFTTNKPIRIPSGNRSVKLTDLIAGKCNKIKERFENTAGTRKQEAERADAEAARRIEKVFDKAEYKGVLSLEKWLPSFTAIQDPKYEDARFFVFPSMRGGYCISCLHTSERGVFRLGLPETWLENKPERCTFVHQSLFMANFEHREDAVRAGIALCEEEKSALYEVEKKPTHALDLPYRSDKALMIAIEKQPALVCEIETPTKEMLKRAVSLDPSLITRIECPSVELKELAAQCAREMRESFKGNKSAGECSIGKVMAYPCVER